jgi:hypothetical protein
MTKLRATRKSEGSAINTFQKDAGIKAKDLGGRSPINEASNLDQLFEG